MALTSADGDRVLRRYEAPQYPNLFFLGSADRRITFYSQQVRALELVYALRLAHRLREDDQIAIVGGGAAGVTAGVALRTLGVAARVIDARDGLFGLQAGSPRMLDPRIYEWPDLGALERVSNLPFLNWGRAKASDVRQRLMGELEQLGHTFDHTPNTTVTTAVPTEHGWRLALSAGDPLQCTKLIIAAGFGDELGIGAVSTVPYWAAAGPPLPSGPNPRTLISGVGDGGLTDALALLVREFEHREFTEWFLRLAPGKVLAQAVIAAEAAAEAAGESDLTPHFSALVLPVLGEWRVLQRLQERLRRDRRLVVNSTSGALLVRDLASRLNQLMAFAVIEAVAARDSDNIAVSRGRVEDVTKVGTIYTVIGPQMQDGTAVGEFDHVILRHGPKRSAHLGWLGGRFGDFNAHREALAQVDPGSDRPPSLGQETYGFFDLALDAVLPEAARESREHTREHAQKTIVIQWDAATASIVEQGAIRLTDALLSDQGGVEVHVRGEPSELKAIALHVARAVRAAGGRLSLTVPTVALPYWLELFATVAARDNSPPTGFNVETAPSPDELVRVMERMLLRRLDYALQSICGQAACPHLGDIHPTIVAAVRPVWAEWLARLEADADLRKEVLRRLRKADSAAEDWDGDLTTLPSLAGALVLMLASSLAIDGLRPQTDGSRANMACTGGLGLGSGSERLNRRFVDDCRDPNDWEVDLLVLSSAVQLELLDGGGSMADAGATSTIQSLAGARRVRPALIKKSNEWRSRLGEPLATWTAHVKAEWAEFQTRQNETLGGLA